MQEIKVSFVVPVYNVEQYLERCIKSILGQTYHNFEVILVDDGSKDDSGRQCDAWAKVDKRIKVIHKENGGLSSARNAGTKIANGEFICYVDSDDWIDFDLLEDFVNIICDEDDVFVFGHRQVINEIELDEREQLIVKSMDGFSALELFVLNKINGYACNKIVRRSLICKYNIGFPEGRNYEDIPTTYKYFVYAHNVKYTEKKYYNYFVSNANSITNQDTYKNLDDFYISCEEMYYGIRNIYDKKNISIVALECFRVNLLIQLFIRITYFLYNHNNENCKSVSDLKQKVKCVLDNQKVSLSIMKEFSNVGKYILYKMHVLHIVTRLNSKRARGYGRHKK